ncbi:HAD family phosphatase [Candidatus Saccharibacteria bacterium]|nr:HAD family phosphatase [Candidatus Saccharibacteria bacterium]
MVKPTNSSTVNKLAVFDVDWTMHPAALGTNFIHQLLLDGIVKADFDIEATYAMWRENPGDTFMSHYKDLFTSLIGLHEDLLRPVAHKVGVDAAHNLYAYTKTELKKHKDDGRFVILISNSPSMALEAFAHEIGADDYSGGDFEFDTSGKLHTMHSTSERLKSSELERIALLHNLTFDDSYGYGDSRDDISMLELVTHPIAVSPKPELDVHAKAHDWEIVYVN